MSEITEEKAEPPKGKRGLIAYTDGSAQLGFAGWGMHGYIFEEVAPKTGTGNSDYILTNGGYRLKSEGEGEAVSIISYVDAFGALPAATTNNYAELAGAIQAFNYALQNEVDVIVLKADSEYVIKGTGIHLPKWKKNNWCGSSGDVIKNLHLWKQLDELHQAAIAKGMEVTLIRVDGHSGVFGNDIADLLAYMGTRHAAAGFVDKVEVNTKPAQGYWKYDNDRHPMFNLRAMYFNSTEEHNIPGEYYLGNHGKDEDMVAKRQGDASYALVRLAKPDGVIETMRQYVHGAARGVSAILFLKMDQMFKSTTHKQFSQWGALSIKRPHEEKLHHFARNSEGEYKDPLLIDLSPPLISQRAVDAILDLRTVLDRFLSGDHPELTVTDLTSIIYETQTETSKKGVVKTSTKLRPEFKVGYSEMPASINYRRPDGSLDVVNIILTLGMDLLDRNGLRHLEDEQPAVSLVTWSEEPQAFRYACIVKTKDDVGIWANTFSNLKIILPKVV